MDIKTVLTRLRCWEYVCRAICLAIISLYIFEIDPFYGFWAGSPSTEYVVMVLVVMLTMTSIPVCLKLIKWVTPSQIISLQGLENQLAAYCKWAIIRCSFLWIAAFVAAMAYVTTLDLSSFWCLAVLCVSDFFIRPSEERLREELNLSEI